MNLITEESEEKLALSQKLEDVSGRLSMTGYTAKKSDVTETPRIAKSRVFIA